MTGKNGRTYRRNRRHLLKSRDPEPLQMHCDIEPELDNFNLENKTETTRKLPNYHSYI